MSWKFGLTALDGTAIGEILNATERKVSLSLNGLPTASFQIRLDNPMAVALTDLNGDVLLKVYQGSTLQFIGDLTSAEEVGGEEKTLACTFAGPLWRLQKRLFGKSAAGDVFTEQPRNAVVDYMLFGGLGANHDKDTGIRKGTFPTLDPISAGPWFYKPIAEALTEIAAAKAPARSAWENFDNIATTGAVTGKTLLIGGTWLGVQGQGNDFQVSSSSGTPNACYRNALNDVGSQANGRFIVASTPTLTNTVAQVDFAHNAFATSGTTAQSGLVLRMQTISGVPDYNNCLVVNVYHALPGGEITISVIRIMDPGGTATVIGSYVSANTFNANIGYSLRVQVDTAGTWSVWFVPVGAAFTTPFSDTDANLATGNALAAGKVGITDWYPNNQPCTRSYDNFSAYDPTAALQSLDFEIVPSEPTADSNQSGVVGAGLKIGTMNIAGTLGSTRDVVFEYGGGNRSVKSYRRVINREGLLTAGYSLPSDVTTGTVQTYQDDAAVTARGYYEEVVPSDVVDSLLRQSLVEAHVNVRKTARQIITFEPSSTAPVFGTDYFVGDVVTARATVNGSVRFNGQFRVYGVDVSIDENGKEEIVPRLVDEG